MKMDGRYYGLEIRDEYPGIKDTARSRTRIWAKRNGVKAESCELCGVTKQQLIEQHNRSNYSQNDDYKPRQRFFVAHHWKGYEFHDDVWWLCYSCNRKLFGKHDGSISKEDARRYIKQHGNFGYG